MNTVAIKDFSFPDEPISFKINDDVFYASPELPLGMLQDIVKLRNLESQVENNGIDSIMLIFDGVLLGESAALFRSRMADRRHPIGIRHIVAIIPWLLEQYGVRPTQPSSPSSNGLSSGETGTNSTDGAHQEALTLSF